MNAILSSKVDVGRRIRQAYQADDKEGLQEIARQELPKLRSQIEHFHALFSHQWMKENKVFGLDTVDIRMGGLLQRIKRAESRIEAYLAGQIDRIDELEVEILPFTDFYADLGLRSHNSQPVAYYCDSFDDLYNLKARTVYLVQSVSRETSLSSKVLHIK